MASDTTNATRSLPQSRIPRRTARVATCTSTRRGSESGCNSDITRRGGVGMGEEAARGVIFVVIIDARRVCPVLRRRAVSVAMAARAVAAGGKAPPRQVRSPPPRRSGPAASFPLCELARRMRGVFSRRGGYVSVSRAAASVRARSAMPCRRGAFRRAGTASWWLGVFPGDAVRAVV